MSLTQSFAIAWQAVKDNRLRSALTALGIVIGIAAVIALVTMGASVQASVSDSFGTPSTRTIDVTAGSTEGFGPGNGPERSRATLSVFSERDVAAIAAIDGVESVAPLTSVPIASVTIDDRTVALSSLTATTADSAALADIADGRPFAPGASEAVISQATVALLGGAIGVGDTLGVRLFDGQQRDLEVVGILAASDGLAAALASGSGVYVPVDPFVTGTVALPSGGDGVRTFSQVAVTIATTEGVADAQLAIGAYLDEASDARHLIPAGQGFLLATNSQVLDEVNDVLGLLTGFVTGIALIALLVGSIGIANIMLVSVTERTREIGIMKAIGGQSRTILSLFLIEAVIHGLIGAVIGTALGLAGGWIGARALGLSAAMPWGWIVAAIVIGVVVGIAAGIYPASRAARLHPIEALRYE